MTLPTISIAAWRADGGAAADVAAQVDDALRSHGFLLVVDHGIDADLAAEVRAEARAWFSQDPAVKGLLRCRVGGRGWIPPGAESNAYASGEESPPDLKETLKFGHAREENRWPDEQPSLRPPVEAYLDQVWQLALTLFDIFAAALRLPDGTFRADASPGVSALNLNWYPSLHDVGPPEDGQFRVGAHSDFGMLTILDRQSGHGCLQIQTADGDWIDAPHVPGSLTINIGDLLARWTGDRWRSTFHRVLPPSPEDAAEELMSLVAFCGIEPSTLVETLDVDGPRNYEPVLAGEYVQSKIDAIDTA
ncbi:MAG: 2OG-Fe(II) oxygenase family protein [Actinomycetota bacterium]